MATLSTYARTLSTAQAPLPRAGSTAPMSSLDQAFKAAHIARQAAAQVGDAAMCKLWANHLQYLRAYTPIR